MHTNARPPLLWSRRNGWVPPGTRHTHSVPLFNWSLSFTLHHWTGSRGKYGKNGKSRQIPIHARVRTLSCSIFANQIGFSLHEQYGVSEINYFRMKNFRCSSGWSWRAHAHNNMQRIKIGRQQSWHKPHRFAHRQCVAPIRYKRGRNNNKLNNNNRKKRRREYRNTIDWCAESFLNRPYGLVRISRTTYANPNTLTPQTGINFRY